MPIVRKILYDIDHCLYPEDQYFGHQIEKWLISTNKALFEAQLAEIKKGEHEKVIIGIGTNRQDYMSDKVNSYRGGSMAPAFPLIQSYLSQQLGNQSLIEFDPFLMADIYDRTEVLDPNQAVVAGGAYRRILTAYNDESQKEQHPRAMFDHSKISLIYAHAHRLATLNPTADCVLDFYDDNSPILSGIFDFFASYPNLLPDRVTLCLNQYKNGSPVIKYEDAIRGTGRVDSQYDWSVRLMASMSYYFGSGANEDHFIETIEGLKNFHIEDHYHAPGHLMDMRIGTDFNRSKFERLREEITPQSLPSNTKITETANYTTAVQLYNQGLIPKEHVLSMIEEEAMPKVYGEKEQLDDGLVKAIQQGVFKEKMLELTCPKQDIKEKTINEFFQALKQNTTIEALSFNGFDLSDQRTVESFAQIIRNNNVTLKTLYFYHCRISCSGAEKIAQALQQNTHLTTLDLSCNSIGNAGAIFLNSALRDRPDLQLSIWWNRADPQMVASLGSLSSTFYQQSSHGTGSIKPADQLAMAINRDLISILSKEKNRLMCPGKNPQDKRVKILKQTISAIDECTKELAKDTTGSFVTIGKQIESIIKKLMSDPEIEKYKKWQEELGRKLLNALFILISVPLIGVPLLGNYWKTGNCLFPVHGKTKAAADRVARNLSKMKFAS